MMQDESSIKPALEKLFQQFSILSHVGYGGSALAGEQGTFRLTTPFTGRVMEGITVLSNMPQLPYGASATRLVQSAVFNWLYVLTHQLYTSSPQVAMLHSNYQWELRMMQVAEESRQLRLFREFLAQKVQELSEHGDTIDILRDLRAICDQAPSNSLRLKCTQLVADNAIVAQAMNGLPEIRRKEFVEWLEPFVT